MRALDVEQIAALGGVQRRDVRRAVHQGKLLSFEPNHVKIWLEDRWTGSRPAVDSDQPLRPGRKKWDS